MVRGKIVTFRKKNGERVSFKTKAKPPAKRKSTVHRKQSTTPRRTNNRIRRSSEQFAEAAITLAYPQYPLIKAGVKLAKDMLDR